MPQYVVKDLHSDKVIAVENNISAAAWHILNATFKEGWKVDTSLERNTVWRASLVTYDAKTNTYTNNKTKQFIVRSEDLFNLHDDVMWLVLRHSRQYGFVVAEVH